PAVRGTVALQSDVSGARSVAVRDRLAYVTNGDAYLGGFRIVDFSVPESPVVIGASGNGYGLTGVALDGGLALFSNTALPGTVPVFDVSSPSSPPILRALPTIWGPPVNRTDYGSGIAAQNGAMFVAGAASLNPFTVFFGMTSNSGLAIGLYRLPVDLASEPPSVAVTSPQPGDTVRERIHLTLTATATDPVRVDSVQFLVDGVPVGTSYAKPYRAQYTVPVGATALRIGAVARDLGGNQTAAQEVTVAVETNTLPVVRLLWPRDGATALSGSNLLFSAQATDDHAVTSVDFLVNGLVVGTALPPNFYMIYPIPNGATSLAVTAVAHDDASASAPDGPAHVTVVPDQPPTAAVVTPADGSQAVEGTFLSILAGASDDGGIHTVNLLVDGSPLSTRFGTPPYLFGLTVPPAGQDLHLQAVATDTGNHSTASSEVTVHSIADPLTAIAGSVVDAHGTPVANAEVDVASDQGFATSTTTGADGTFLAANLPTVLGNFTIAVSGIAQGCSERGALTTPITPLPGGTLDVGGIALSSPAGFDTTTVTGHVIDEDGQPVAGVSVTVYSEDFGDEVVVTTGADGGFSAPDFPARAWGIAAVGGGFVNGMQLVGSIGSSAAVPGGTTDLGTFVVDSYDPSGDPGFSVTGRIVDTDGNPVVGIRVSAFVAFLFFTTTTAADGTFSFTGFPSFNPVVLGAARPDTCAYFATPGTPLGGGPGDAIDVGTLVLRQEVPPHPPEQ
ncbi:MAG: Ig-like domain-containing protein, partial [Thermoanaerobaculia bacterium]